MVNRDGNVPGWTLLVGVGRSLLTCSTAGAFSAISYSLFASVSVSCSVVSSFAHIVVIKNVCFTRWAILLNESIFLLKFLIGKT